MSSTGIKNLIQRLEAVDLAFTGFWSKPIILKFGTLYLNQDLPNDIFFNKLTNLSCIDDKAIKESLDLFEKHHTTPYIYTLNRPDFEQKLLEKNFKLHDTQQVLVKSPSSEKASTVHRTSDNESMTWSKIFCKSYDCIEWLDSVNNLVKNSSDTIGYYIDKSMSSCIALYEDNSMLGLYCLGTVPKMRNKGYAASLIDFALSEVKRRNLEFLMLETYQRDKLVDFYFKLGFKEIYKKNIFTI